ncbi:MAG: TorD/DmsD family molecular chaperone [Shewanella sp.]
MTSTIIDFIEYQGIARILHHVVCHYPETSLLNEFIEHDVAASWPTLAARASNTQGRAALSRYLSQWQAQDSHAKDSQLIELQLDYGQLLFGPGEPKAIPQGSVYLSEEQLLNDRSTVALMDFYKTHGVELTLNYRQPLDHIGLFFSVLDSSFGRLAKEPTNLELTQFIQILLQQHLLPWSGRCLELAAKHADSKFYQGMALLADDFLCQLAADFKVVAMPMRLFR